MLLEEFLINKDKTIIEAIRQLDSVTKKILFVIDDNNKLIGSLTDGDIRRFILKKGSLDGKVDEACFKKTLFIKNSFSEQDILKLFNKDILAIPVINENKEILEIIFNDKNKIFNKNLNVPLVIMAGGVGSRLEPITKIIPKALLPINDKSIIEIIIGNFLKYGVKEYYISINYKSSLIKSYFSEINLPCEIKYIEENEPLGTIGCLYMIKNKIKSEYFILTNCDIIINSDYYDIVKFHVDNNNLLTVVACIESYKIPYGVCNIKEDGELVNIEEKPEINFLFNTGMYVINNEVLQEIPENKFFHITDLINILKLKNKKVSIYPISKNSWIDIGEWSKYSETLNRFKI
ncbi:MAG: mannose-1-phosphate guanylyltransferase [Candidatus Sericytochromatia bacterium]|nr:MAG: mannose-1-phosphate guanylyltransferase [Candidatus Sericytochromatia bacterium]